MLEDGISFHDVMSKSFFVSDQRELVEKMIKLIKFQFEVSYRFPDTSYDCRLLSNFSNDDSLSSSTIDGLLKIGDLKERLNRQIKMELDGHVTVQNIVKPKLPKETIDYWVRLFTEMLKNLTLNTLIHTFT